MCLFFICRLGQTIIWLSRWRWQFILFVWDWLTVRANVHHQRCHRLRCQFGDKHMFLHKEWQQFGHSIRRFTGRFNDGEIDSSANWNSICIPFHPQAILYPTVGLQTPGEVVDANFGQAPFLFDIEDMRRGLRKDTKETIYNFPLPDDQGDWPGVLNK